jgi:hypothetical protein
MVETPKNQKEWDAFLQTHSAKRKPHPVDVAR